MRAAASATASTSSSRASSSSSRVGCGARRHRRLERAAPPPRRRGGARTLVTTTTMSSKPDPSPLNGKLHRALPLPISTPQGYMWNEIRKLRPSTAEEAECQPTKDSCSIERIAMKYDERCCACDGCGIVKTRSFGTSRVKRSRSTQVGGVASVALVPIRPRSRGERRSLRTFAVVPLHPGSLPFNPRLTPFDSPPRRPHPLDDIR